MLDTHANNTNQVATTRRVLLVDPSRDDRMALRDSLRATRLALDVTVTPSIGTARALLDCNDFDFTLVCLSLAPEEALGFIKAAANQSTVIALSGGDMTLNGNAVRAGAQDILLKAHADGPHLRRCIEEGLVRRRQPAGFTRDAPTQQIPVPQRTPTTEDITDSVTNLRDRGGLNRRLSELSVSARQGGPGYCLVLIAIDQMVEFEFVHGTAARDKMLGQVGAFLRKLRGGVDTVARFDADRFALLITESNVMESMVLAERVRKRLTGCFKGTAEGVTVSFGVAEFAPDGGTVKELIAAAEAGRRNAQRRGGGVGVAAEAA
jgi:diguanylate cyclase (GGDEF)-like protein